MRNTRRFLRGIPVVALGAFALSASADQVTYSSAPFSGQTNFTAAIPEFDPTLGALTAATITLDGQVALTASVFNPGSSPEPFNYAFCTTLTTNPVTDQVVFTPSPLTWADPYGNSGQTDDTALTLNGIANAGPGITNFPGTPVTADLISPVPLADLGGFEGVGTTNFAYVGAGGMNYGGEDLTLFFGGNRNFSGTDSVTYTYTAVPEPTSLSLLGIGALALIGRRRKA